MKKSQAEIMGLLAIVVMFIFGGLLYIMFAAKGGSEPLTRDVVQYEKVESLLDSFVQLTPCYDKVPYDNIETIIKRCHPEGDAEFCGKNCKDVIKDEFKGVVNAYDPNKEYEFRISKGNIEFLSLGICPPKADKRVGNLKFTDDMDTLTLQMAYCINVTRG